MELITNIFAFVLVIIILVFVHEYGHYYIAKKCNVKVLKFAIGFGKTIIKWQTKHTEYHIKVIPLGGFVEMLDSRKHQVNDEQQHLAFNNKNIYQKYAIILAGPMANILLAITLYSGVFIYGYQDIKPIVKNIVENSKIAQAGLAPNDEFISINNNKTHGISSVISNIINDSENLVINVISANNTEKTLKLSLDKTLLSNNNNKSFAQLFGFNFKYPPLSNTIGGILNNSPAQKLKLKIGDKIIAINNKEITNWQQILSYIKKNPNTQLTIAIKRNNAIWYESIKPIKNNNNYYIGIKPVIPDNYYITITSSPLESIKMAFQQSYKLALLNINAIIGMIKGEVSIKNISGPGRIAKYAGDSISSNLINFIKLLALLSISVGVINLLPIPLLDGGYLAFYTIEILTRIKISDKIQQIFNALGLIFIVLLILVTLYNDIIYLAN